MFECSSIGEKPRLISHVELHVFSAFLRVLLEMLLALDLASYEYLCITYLSTSISTRKQNILNLRLTMYGLDPQF
jgi:hypothetical protein